MLNQTITKDKVLVMERLLGRAQTEVSSIVQEVMKEMTVTTDYPPDFESVLLSPEVVTETANALVTYVQSLKDSGGE